MVDVPKSLPTNTPGKTRNYEFRDKIAISDHTAYNFPHGNGDPAKEFSVFRRRNDSKRLIGVGEMLLCQSERTKSDNPFAVAVTAGEFIVGRDKVT